MYRTLQYALLFLVAALLQIFLFNNLSLSVYLNPLVAMVVSVLFLHETITVYMLIGAGLILGGVMISEKKPRKPRAVSSLPSTPSHS